MRELAEQMTECILNAIGVAVFKRILTGLIAGGLFYQLAIYLEKSLCG